MLKVDNTAVYTSDLIQLSTREYEPRTYIQDISKIVCDDQEVWKAADWNWVYCSASKTSNTNTLTDVGVEQTFYLAGNIIPSCKRFSFSLEKETWSPSTLPLYFENYYKGNVIYTEYIYLENMSVNGTFSTTKPCYYYNSDTGEYVRIGTLILGQSSTPSDNIIPYSFRLDNSDYPDPIYQTWKKVQVSCSIRYEKNTTFFSGNQQVASISGSGYKNVPATITNPKIHAIPKTESYTSSQIPFQVDVTVTGASNGSRIISLGEGAQTITNDGYVSVGIVAVEEGQVRLICSKATTTPFNYNVYVTAITGPGMNET